jgi:hypothetical protein
MGKCRVEHPADDGNNHGGKGGYPCPVNILSVEGGSLLPKNMDDKAEQGKKQKNARNTVFNPFCEYPVVGVLGGGLADLFKRFL